MRKLFLIGVMIEKDQSGKVFAKYIFKESVEMFSGESLKRTY